MRMFLALPLLSFCLAAQSTPSNASRLAESGHCAEALPQLRRTLPLTTDRQSKRRLGVDGMRCAMTMDRWEDAGYFVGLLTREFPDDPEILYMAAHAYSDLSIRASQKLLYAAPESAEVHELNAESLESQGRWDEAAAEYKRVLEANPKQAGMHYRLGRLILSKPKSERTSDEARKEMEAELALDPDNAGAEYVLGELARQAERWPEAITHFQRAAQRDAGFADAFLGWGQACLSAEFFTDAVKPLETAVRMQPENPTAHYLLAVAYTRVGRKDEAAREKRAQEEAAKRAQSGKDRVKLGVAGQSAPKP